MSDERFEHDLRTALSSLAPGAAGPPLRQRVALIPTSNPAPPSFEFIWRLATTGIVIVAAVVLALLLGQPHNSTAPPTGSATVLASPSVGATRSVVPSQTPSCKAAAEPPFYQLVGWARGKIYLTAMHIVGCDITVGLVSIEPTSGTLAELPLPAGASPYASTDGADIAVRLGSSGVLVLDATNHKHVVSRPSGVGDDWNAYGLPPLAGGGFMVTGSQHLLRIAADGSGITSDPLPAGYVAVAPTSDPNRFILATVADAQQEYGLTARAPITAYLWTRSSGAMEKVATSVKVVARASKALAYLLTGRPSAENGTWSALSSDGRLTTLIDAPGFQSQISPDGTQLLSELRPTTSGADSYEVRLTRVATGATLATLPGQGGAAVWNDGTVAILMQSSMPRSESPRIVMVDPAGGQKAVQLP